MAASTHGTTAAASQMLRASATMLPASSRSIAVVGSSIIYKPTISSQLRGFRGYHSAQLKPQEKRSCFLGHFERTRSSAVSPPSVSSVHRQSYHCTRQFSVYSAQRLFGSKNDGAQGQVRPKKRFRLLRWTFRLTYLAGLLGVGYVGYGIYVSRSPAEQLEPDPSKKTLVVLGTLCFVNQRDRGL